MHTKKDIFERLIKVYKKTDSVLLRRPVHCLNISVQCNDCPYFTLKSPNIFESIESNKNCHSKFRRDFKLYTNLNAWNKLKCKPKKIL